MKQPSPARPSGSRSSRPTPRPPAGVHPDDRRDTPDPVVLRPGKPVVADFAERLLQRLMISGGNFSNAEIVALALQEVDPKLPTRIARVVWLADRRPC